MKENSVTTYYGLLNFKLSDEPRNSGQIFYAEEIIAYIGLNALRQMINKLKLSIANVTRYSNKIFLPRIAPKIRFANIINVQIKIWNMKEPK